MNAWIVNSDMVSQVLRKLNLEKAYDHISRDFLFYIFRICGFGEKWRNWIAHCIATVHFSILINDTPSGYFNSSCRLR